MPTNLIEDTRLDLALTQEENLDWEALLVATEDKGLNAMQYCIQCVTCGGCGTC